MVRPTRAQGRPGTPVIPTAWEAGHRPVVDKAATATIELRKPGTHQDWVEAEQQNMAVPFDPYYDGAARVQALPTEAREVMAADDPETLAQYLVVVPASVSPAENDLVTVTTSGDPLLTDQELRVVQVVMGSLRFERDLKCVLNT